MKAIEIHGQIDERRKLRVDDSPIDAPPGRVRIIVLVPENGDLDEAQWLRSAARNSAFEFLRSEEEDIYTAADGKPLHER